jgi:hypothetical protein
MGDQQKGLWMAHGVQIGKVARATGLSVDTIRFYEKEGLLREPERSEGGFRLYSDLKRLERHLTHAFRKCEDALGDGKAGPIHEHCPVLEEISGSKNGKGKR